MSEALTLDAQPGLDGDTLSMLRATRALALARHHDSPVALVVIDGETTSGEQLAFEQPSDRTRTAWADSARTTEWAAEAIALEVVHSKRGMGVISRAARGTRFDYYVGVPGEDLEHATALEIGGTDTGSIRAVLTEKVAQIAGRGARIPGIAVAVQLATPCAMLRDA